jgi:hypothetical protein
MKKKLVVVLALAALVVVGASAQLVIGVSGALPMYTAPNNAQEITTAFQTGNGIYWGGFLEIIMHKVGIGASVNTAVYPNYLTQVGDRIIDEDLYLSLHLFGGRAFLDPFAELGAGAIGTILDGDSIFSQWIDGSYYWYAALGLGINLGPIGINAKFAWNNNIGAMQGTQTPSTAFGTVMFGEPNPGANWIPPFRFTLAAKLIL